MPFPPDESLSGASATSPPRIKPAAALAGPYSIPRLDEHRRQASVSRASNPENRFPLTSKPLFPATRKYSEKLSQKPDENRTINGVVIGDYGGSNRDVKNRVIADTICSREELAMTESVG
jgi:hypothetical protein